MPQSDIFYDNPDDGRLGGDFIYKNSFLSVGERTSAVAIKAAFDITTPADTTIVLPACDELKADDDLNNGFVIVKNKNGNICMFKIKTSVFATLTLTIDITDALIGDAADQETKFSTQDYYITVIMQKRYLGEIKTDIDLNPGAEYVEITSRQPQKKWLTFETVRNQNLNFDLSSNEKTLAKVNFKLKQLGDSKFFVQDLSAKQRRFFIFVEGVALASGAVRNWFFPNCLFKANQVHKISAASGSELVYSQEVAVDEDGIVGGAVIREEE